MMKICLLFLYVHVLYFCSLETTRHVSMITVTLSKKELDTSSIGWVVVSYLLHFYSLDYIDYMHILFSGDSHISSKIRVLGPCFLCWFPVVVVMYSFKDVVSLLWWMRYLYFSWYLIIIITIIICEIPAFLITKI